MTNHQIDTSIRLVWGIIYGWGCGSLPAPESHGLTARREELLKSWSNSCQMVGFYCRLMGM